MIFFSSFLSLFILDHRLTTFFKQGLKSMMHYRNE